MTERGTPSSTFRSMSIVATRLPISAYCWALVPTPTDEETKYYRWLFASNVNTVIYNTIILYVLSAWSGYLSRNSINRLDAIFKKAVRWKLTQDCHSFEQLLAQCDCRLFSRAVNCLHHVLPIITGQVLRYRECWHPFELLISISTILQAGLLGHASIAYDFVWYILSFVTGSIARSTTCRYLIYS